MSSIPIPILNYSVLSAAYAGSMSLFLFSWLSSELVPFFATFNQFANFVNQPNVEISLLLLSNGENLASRSPHHYRNTVWGPLMNVFNISCCLSNFPWITVIGPSNWFWKDMFSGSPVLEGDAKVFTVAFYCWCCRGLSLSWADFNNVISFRCNYVGVHHCCFLITEWSDL